MTNSKAACAAAEQTPTPQVREYIHIIVKRFLKISFLDGGEETEETMQMQGEDERREDNTAAGEEETTFTTNTEVSNNLCHGHQISASVHQVSSPGASTSDVVINVE